MSPRRLPISRGMSAAIGLALLMVLGGCASSDQAGVDDPPPSNGIGESETAAEDRAPSSASGNSSAEDAEGGVAERAESFANRVEQRLQANRVEQRLQQDGGGPPEPNTAGPKGPEAAAANTATGHKESSGQWKSQLQEKQEDPDSTQSPAPPLQAAGDQRDAAPDASAATPSPGSSDSPDPQAPSDSSDADEATESASAEGDAQDAASAAEQAGAADDEAGAEQSVDRLSFGQLLDEMRRRLRDRAAQRAEPLRPYLALGALSVLDPETALGESELTGLSDGARRSLLAYQEAFAGLGEALQKPEGDGLRELRRTAEQLTDELRKHRPLRIQRAELCTRVDGYGVYTPIPDHQFTAGREHPVIVYAEVANFTPERDENDRYVVRLNQRIVLYNESDGLAVWRPQSSETKIVDRSRNRRRDFFVVQVIRLPARLTVGKYRLKLTLTDEIGQSLDEATIPIRITADSEVASGSDQ